MVGVVGLSVGFSVGRIVGDKVDGTDGIGAFTTFEPVDIPVVVMVGREVIRKLTVGLGVDTGEDTGEGAGEDIGDDIGVAVTGLAVVGNDVVGIRVVTTGAGVDTGGNVEMVGVVGGEVVGNW